MSLATLHDWHRPLGSTGLRVSPLGLGTVKLGRDQGVKYPNGFSIPDDAAARALLDQARELGINLLDTAPAYGVSEERLGPLLRGQREDWVIVSKVGEEFDNGQSRFDFSPAHTRLSVERSLQRLETDRIDLVLVHSDGNDVAILRDSGVYETLAELKREGKLRAFGLSGKTVEGGLLALERGDADGAADLIYPARAVARSFGGSHAQRDLIDWTLTEAALRGKRQTVAEALARERLAQRPHSGMNRQFLRRALAPAVRCTPTVAAEA